MIRSGLPEPELNPRLYRAGRFLARADLVYRAQRVIVEYDGEKHRTDDRQYDRDLVRLDALRDAGWTIVQVRKQGLRPSGLAHTLAASEQPS
jgi:very-short-patch-repair endonuclease